MENDELLKRAADLAERCERTSSVTHTAFLTPAEQFALTKWANTADCKMVLTGGHPDCERKAAFFLPFYMEADEFDAADYICAVTAKAGFGEPAHRDYLGAALGRYLGDGWHGDNFLPAER